MKNWPRTCASGGVSRQLPSLCLWYQQIMVLIRWPRAFFWLVVLCVLYLNPHSNMPTQIICGYDFYYSTWSNTFGNDGQQSSTSRPLTVSTSGTTQKETCKLETLLSKVATPGNVFDHVGMGYVADRASSDDVPNDAMSANDVNPSG